MKKFYFQPNAHSIILEVELEYKRKFTAGMIFDTGASFTIITPKVAIELGYDLSTLPSIPLFTASREESTLMLELKTVSIGGDKRISKVSARCMLLPSDLKIDGLLGLNFLRHFNINLNFEQGILTFNRISRSI